MSQASALSDRPLHPLEADICRRAMAGRHGFGGALDADRVAQLRAMQKQGGVARAIVAALMDGLVWRLRDEEEANRPLARALIEKVMGPLGLGRVLARRAIARVSGEAPGFALSERREPLS